MSADSGSNQISVRLGVGDGTFAAAATYATGSFPYSVYATDLNGDGHPDLMSADYGSNQISIFLWTPDT